MPKNCKGCVRYKLLTIYQYAQKHRLARCFLLFNTNFLLVLFVLTLTYGFYKYARKILPALI